MSYTLIAVTDLGEVIFSYFCEVKPDGDWLINEIHRSMIQERAHLKDCEVIEVHLVKNNTEMPRFFRY